jgi:2-polyprenyl-6-hydroxyphenyl methylase / 3-demethylubiquinone-9 3-methyltransferase
MNVNADPEELARFDALAQRWWDPRGEFGALHRLNPLRLRYVSERVTLKGARALDVGCGGGLLTEGLAREGAHVTGVDLAPSVLKVARLHALEAGLPVEYREIAAETLADESPGQFAVVTCMELLEHVPDPAQLVEALARLTAPGGAVFVSTINRTVRAFALATVAAEYVLGWLPRGTHEYARFIRPSELARMARQAGLEVLDVSGMAPQLASGGFRLTRDPSVNYLAWLRRPAA